MAKLEWDKVGERFYETGVEKGVLYPQSAQGTYPLGVAWNGLTGFNYNPEGGDSNDKYADNIKYLSLVSAENAKFTIEAFTYPKEFEPCDGVATIPGTPIQASLQNRASFGFAVTTIVGNDTKLNDYGETIHIFYGCTAKPSGRNYQSINNSPDNVTFSWECSATPVASGVEGIRPTSYIRVATAGMDAQKLKKLKDKLYGTDEAEPSLPSLSELVTLLK